MALETIYWDGSLKNKKEKKEKEKIKVNHDKSGLFYW